MVSVRSSSSGIAVSWREPNCSDVNDESVTGYRVRYGVLSETQRTTTPTSGTKFTISDNDLFLFTDYSVEVAAVNNRGAGTFTQPKIGVITGGENLGFEVSLSVIVIYCHSQLLAVSVHCPLLLTFSQWY
jgi:hypothetical protein